MKRMLESVDTVHTHTHTHTTYSTKELKKAKKIAFINCIRKAD